MLYQAPIGRRASEYRGDPRAGRNSMVTNRKGTAGEGILPLVGRPLTAVSLAVVLSWVLLTSPDSATAADSPPNVFRWRALPPLPEPLGLAGPFAGVSGDALIVAGGASFSQPLTRQAGRKRWSDTILVLEDPDGSWVVGGQ